MTAGPPPGLRAGDAVGPYRVARPLGRGGAATVYLCAPPAGRPVVVKVAHPGPAAAACLAREAAALAAVRHSRVVRAVGTPGPGYLVLEYLPGPDLGALVRSGGRVPAPVAVGYIHQAARGLRHLHARGWLHRDIKPENLVVGRDGAIKLIDFGSAGRPADPPTDVIWGAAHTLAPELLRGSPAADARADVYGLGAVLHYMLSGRHLYPPRSTAETMLRALVPDAHPRRHLPADVPAELSAAVGRMAAADPAERYPDMVAVVRALQRVRLMLSRPG